MAPNPATPSCFLRLESQTVIRRGSFNWEPAFCSKNLSKDCRRYRPKRTAHQAVQRVAKAIVQCKTHIIDLDLKAYFDTVRHHLLLDKVARRINDDDVLRLLKLVLTASGKRGVPQGGEITPPYGEPSVDWRSCPFFITPAFNHLSIIRRITPSVTRRSRNARR